MKGVFVTFIKLKVFPSPRPMWKQSTTGAVLWPSRRSMSRSPIFQGTSMICYRYESIIIKRFNVKISNIPRYKYDLLQIWEYFYQEVQCQDLQCPKVQVWFVIDMRVSRGSISRSQIFQGTNMICYRYESIFIKRFNVKISNIPRYKYDLL